MPAEAPRDYAYVSLADAETSIDQRVHFHAVVEHAEPPKDTRGRDKMCTLVVRDMSRSNPGLRVICFAPTFEQLPAVRAPGDIIRFHRIHSRKAAVQMLTHNGAPQAQAHIKAGCSFVLFEGQRDGSMVPYHKSSKEYTPGGSLEMKAVEILRAWALNNPVNIRPKQYLTSIEGVKHDTFFDLYCKIVFVDQREYDGAVMMYAWDGTDAPPTPLQASEFSKAFCHVEEQQEDASAGPAPPSRFPPLPYEVLRQIPTLGTTLPVVFAVAREELPQPLPREGDWVRFRNLRCWLSPEGMYEAIFARASKVYHLRPDTPQLQEITRAYDARKEKADLRNPTSIPPWIQADSLSLTITDHENVGYMPLREVLAHPEVTHKFRCVVRLVDLWPRQVEHFCMLRRKSSQPGNGTSATPCAVGELYCYRLLLTLEDPTARVQAWLVGEDGVKFFNGHPPADFHQPSATADALRRKVWRLLGQADDSGTAKGKKDPSWMKCCLKSYYVDKACPRTSRLYSVFGTTMV
eukprot:SM000058S18480  [mRNA]  locus=s58:112590:115867:+ [translate_table: standard]